MIAVSTWLDARQVGAFVKTAVSDRD